MKFPAFFSLWILGFLGATSVVAQEEAPLLSAAESTDQKIRSEDSISVSVLDEGSISGVFRVGNDGNINYPLLGRIQVVGLSIDQAAAEIERLLEQDFIRDAVVSVTMANRQEYSVFITGAVRGQGSVNFDPEEGITLGRAVARVGGASENANTRQIEIQRSQNGELKKILASLSNEQDLPLRDSDIVVVPSKPVSVPSTSNAGRGVPIRPEKVIETGTVLVLGEVNAPGLVEIPLEGGSDILEVIVKARGFSRLAWKKKVRVQRKSSETGSLETITVDVEKMTRADAGESFFVYPGDRIFVPESLF